jgi:hypothetical protein
MLMQQQEMYEHLDEQHQFQHHLNTIVQLNLYKILIIQLEEYSNNSKEILDLFKKILIYLH